MAEIFTVKDLNAKTHTQLINDEIKSIYNTIKDKIIEKHASDLNELTFGLPSTFSIPMDRQIVQAIVYGNIIDKLANGGFKVTYTPTEDSGTLTIRWPSVISKSEVDRCKLIIKNHLNNQQQTKL